MIVSMLNGGKTIFGNVTQAEAHNYGLALSITSSSMWFALFFAYCMMCRQPLEPMSDPKVKGYGCYAQCSGLPFLPKQIVIGFALDDTALSLSVPLFSLYVSPWICDHLTWLQIYYGNFCFVSAASNTSCRSLVRRVFA
jgi:hypothetical protein